MTILGISAGFHDAAVSVVDETTGAILFAGHSERYSKHKHDSHLCEPLMREALSYGDPSIVSYYERPWVKKTRQLYAGQWSDAVDMSDLTVQRYLSKHCPAVKLDSKVKFQYHNHHLSHVAAAFQTSPFDRATVVVIDAIGEWDTISIYGAQTNRDGTVKYAKLWGKHYPHSIGLLYSAMTERVGLKPLDEEYILMGMAAYGTPIYLPTLRRDLVYDFGELEMKHNLHCGLNSEYQSFTRDVEQNNFDLAASTQLLTEELINNVMFKAAELKWSSNLVFTGGVALNCSANRHLGKWFDNIWIMPNPGDAGSSLGAAAMSFKKKLQWDGPYLGTNIDSPYPVAALIEQLSVNKIVGVASGRAEFGPRALGNRSLLADPRGGDIKDKVNEIKRRQKFRPFAPVILEEFMDHYFAMPSRWNSSPYMQVTAPCLRPDAFPAIIHADGTSRVQTVAKDCKSGIRQLLEQWYKKTGCPMLLNTSLNIRGEPMVNDRSDADRFQDLYNVTVIS